MLSFNNTVLTLDTQFASQTFNYGGTVVNGVSATGTQDYVVTYIKSGAYQQDGYLNHHSVFLVGRG